MNLLLSECCLVGVALATLPTDSETVADAIARPACQNAAEMRTRTQHEQAEAIGWLSVLPGHEPSPCAAYGEHGASHTHPAKSAKALAGWTRRRRGGPFIFMCALRNPGTRTGSCMGRSICDTTDEEAAAACAFS